MHGMAGAKRMPETEQATGTLSGADAESLIETARMADRNRLLSVLLHVSNLTGHDADVRTLAEAVLERLHGLLFCDGSLCYVQEGNRLVNLAQKGPIRDIVGKHPIMNQLLPIGQTFLNRRQPLIIPDLWLADAATTLLRDQMSLFLEGPGAVARCWLFLPMILRGRTVGVILAAHHVPGQFDAEDRVFGAAFAHQAAIEFENARLDRDARKRSDEVRTMLQVQRAITKRVELVDVLQLIADEACRLTASGGALVFLEEQGSWRLAGASGRTSSHVLEVERDPSLVQSALSDMGRTGRPYHLQQGHAGSVRHEGFLRQYGLESLLCVPVVSEDGTLGLVGVTQPAEGGFQADDLRILSLLSSSAVIGVENARLYESERRLRAQESERAATAERSRLARELHDAVTQSLFSASLIAEVLPRIWEKNPEQGRERLEEVRLLTRGALAEMRTLLLELRPKVLESTTLEELLKHLSAAAAGRSGMEVSSTISGCDGLPFEVKLALYRIVQEALNNIVKHARATFVRIQMKGNGFCQGVAGVEAGVGCRQTNVSIRANEMEKSCTLLEMEIRDDGEGFNPDFIPDGHLGVGIMRERAASIGATFEMESGKKHGTTIRVLWQQKKAGSGES